MKGFEHSISIRQVSNGYMVRYQFGKPCYSMFGSSTYVEEQELIAASLTDALQMIVRCATECDGMSDQILESKVKLLTRKESDD